ncbi:MAG: hypothetical protein ABIJ82_02350 [Patescibacteria group bacterium]|nr:hypothetical protein [Patescibacteria group bacterium]MBU1952843.1 hypothetical protein [Patescibacteria group bacterium]
MDYTQKDTSIIDTQNDQESYELIQKLLREARGVINSIADSDVKRKQKMAQLSKEIDDGINEVNKLCLELDQIEQAAGVELDKIVLNQIQDLTQDEE